MKELSFLSPVALRKILALVEDREKLTAELATVEARLAKFGGLSLPTLPAATRVKIVRRKAAKPKHAAPPAAAYAASSTTAPEPTAKRNRRGNLSHSIIAALGEKPDGLSVPELARIVGSKPASLHVFFNTTGKKIPGLKKIGRGIYALAPSAAPQSDMPSAPPSAASESAAPESAIVIEDPAPPAPMASEASPVDEIGSPTLSPATVLEPAPEPELDAPASAENPEPAEPTAIIEEKFEPRSEPADPIESEDSRRTPAAITAPHIPGLE